MVVGDLLGLVAVTPSVTTPEVSIVVRPPNELPVLTIDTPADGEAVMVGEPLVLTGTATDTEDGDLSAQIAWTSSVDGVLGTGASLTLTNLSSATHTLTANVTDLDGAPVSETVHARLSV